MKKVLFLGLLILVLTDCNHNDANDPIAADCTVVACTNEFVTLTVLVKDKDGVLIPLDRFEVVDSKTAEDITPELSSEEFQTARQIGRYPIYSDAFLMGNQNTQKNLVFRGFINEERLVNAEIVVAIDCCHVSIASGDTTIVIN
ncbi:MAG: hypothetical protein Mars2KO_26980 [Maribacter sp.]